ncbi:uncharacterized protein ACUXNS_001848 [Brevibacterium pityocampae]
MTPRTPAAGTTQDLSGVLLGLGGALRRAGLPVTPPEMHLLVAAAARLDPLDPRQVRAASRAICCREESQIAVHDAVFARYFGLRPSRVEPPAPVPVRTPDSSGAGEAPGTETGVPEAAASRTELLRRTDLGDGADREAAARLIDGLTVQRPVRIGARTRRAVHGPVDLERTLRALARADDLPRLPRRRPLPRPRRVVLVLDVSASMRPWLDAIIRFARRWRIEADARVFTVGTRLTHVTAELGEADAGAALERMLDHVPDAVGGTRLGDSLGTLLDSNALAVRGSVCVLVSDGWETGSMDSLDHACERLARLSRRFLWVNPRAGRPGWEPATRAMGIAAAHAERTLPGTTVADWEQVAATIGRAPAPGREPARA